MARLFASGAVGMSTAKAGDDVVCDGINSCKGTGSCHGVGQLRPRERRHIYVDGGMTSYPGFKTGG